MNGETFFVGTDFGPISEDEFAWDRRMEVWALFIRFSWSFFVYVCSSGMCELALGLSF